MLYTVKSSHPGVDFGNVQERTFTNERDLNLVLNALVGSGYYIQITTADEIRPLVTGPSVELVEGA